MKISAERWVNVMTETLLMQSEPTFFKSQFGSTFSFATLPKCWHRIRLCRAKYAQRRFDACLSVLASIANAYLWCNTTNGFYKTKTIIL